MSLTRAKIYMQSLFDGRAIVLIYLVLGVFSLY